MGGLGTPSINGNNGVGMVQYSIKTTNGIHFKVGNIRRFDEWNR
jgi:hypothetical protein